MVIVSKSKSYVCNYDWLSFSVRLENAEPEIECPEHWRLDVFPGTNVYRHRAILHDPNGCKVLTFCWCPYSKALQPNVATCQIANPMLYEQGINVALPLLNSCVACVFNSWSRIDICLDFQASDYHLGMIRRLFTGALYVAAKSEGSDFWHRSEYKGARTTFSHCLSWGSKSSQFKWKLYNKSREQNMESGQSGQPDKPYIIGCWRDAGFDVSKVWRLEVSMVDSGGLQWEGRKLGFDEILCDEWFKFRVFCDMYERRFIIRRNEGKARSDRETRVWLFKFDLDTIQLKRKPTNPNPKPRPEIITQFRKLICCLESSVSKSADDVFLAMYNAVATMVERYHLERYCEHALGSSLEHWAERVFSDVGDGVHEAVPTIERDIA